jgi:hypothetical protein
MNAKRNTPGEKTMNISDKAFNASLYGTAKILRRLVAHGAATVSDNPELPRDLMGLTFGLNDTAGLYVNFEAGAVRRLVRDGLAVHVGVTVEATPEGRKVAQYL